MRVSQLNRNDLTGKYEKHESELGNSLIYSGDTRHLDCMRHIRQDVASCLETLEEGSVLAFQGPRYAAHAALLPRTSLAHTARMVLAKRRFVLL